MKISPIAQTAMTPPVTPKEGVNNIQQQNQSGAAAITKAKSAEHVTSLVEISRNVRGTKLDMRM